MEYFDHQDAPAEKPPTARGRSAERILFGLAEDGVLTRRDALAAGVSRREIEHRTSNGLLIVEGRGVYRLAGSTRQGRTAHRCALAATGASCLGLWSALEIHGISRGLIPPKVHVVVKRPREPRSTPWYDVHPTRHLDDDEIVVVDGRKTSTIPRTVRDLAAALPYRPASERKLGRWVEEALALGKLELPALERAAASETSDAVRARLTTLAAAQRGSDPQLFRSVGERWLRDLVERRGLPMPLFNVRAAGGILAEADAWYPDVPLIVEFDSHAFHKTRTKHDADRQRDRVALRHGIPTLRVTETDYQLDLPALERDIERLVLGESPVPFHR